MGKLDGRVALVTGGARGQGRSHCVALAREGADIIFCDLAEQIAAVPYPMGNEEDLKETVRLVEVLGRRCVAVKADVRSTSQMQALAERAISEFGKIDILVANAGVSSFSTLAEMTEEQWDTVVDTDLKGTFNSIRAVVPHMLNQNYGRVIAISSMSGRIGQLHLGHYVAAKWGVIGLIKTLALEVAQNGITANCVLPCTVNTPMAHNDTVYRLFRPDLENPTKEDVMEAFKTLQPMPIPYVEPEDISAAVLFLVSDEARYISGAALPVSAGWIANNSA